MENKVLNENLQAIGRYNSELVNKILTTEIEKSNIVVEKNQNNQYNIFVSGFPLHDINNPEQESKDIAQKITDKDSPNKIRIVYGLGLGYLIDEVSNVVTKSNIILYEPNIDILKYVLQIAQIDALFKYNVFVATNKQELDSYIRKLANSETEISVTFLNSYKLLFEKDIVNVLNISQRIIGELCGRKNIEVRNLHAAYYTFLNLPKIVQNPDVVQLFNIYKGKTALIASAGATLSENIETIKENKDKAVIFALNQNVRYLMENGIKPDFIVNIDAYDNRNHFRGVDTKDSYLIFEGFCNNEIFSLPSKKTFNYISDENFYNYLLRDWLSIKHNLKSSGTVSVTAFLSACIMGFDKIILIGQDLAYKDGQCYAKGSAGENLECKLENGRYVVKPKDWDKFYNSMKKDNQTYEECCAMIERYLTNLNKNIYTIKGQNGELLPTLTSYSYFVDYFSELAAVLKSEKPELELINSSIGGAQIDGFKNIDLKTALKGLPIVNKINLENVEPCYDKNRIVIRMTEFENKIESVIKEYSEVENICKNILEELDTQNTITDSTRAAAGKIKPSLEEILNKQDDSLIRIVVNDRVKIYREQIPEGFENEIGSLRNALSLILSKQPDNISLEFYKQQLANCKSVILK